MEKIKHTRHMLLLVYKLQYNNYYAITCCKLKKKQEFVSIIIINVLLGSNIKSTNYNRLIFHHFTAKFDIVSSQ